MLQIYIYDFYYVTLDYNITLCLKIGIKYSQGSS